MSRRDSQAKAKVREYLMGRRRKLRLRNLIGRNPNLIMMGCLGLFGTALLLGLSRGTPADTIKTSLESRLYHHVRDVINPVTLHPRLKLLAYDDRVAAGMRTYLPALNEWQNLLTSLSLSKPAVIVFDKLFDRQDYPKGERQAFADALTKLQVPLITTAFATEAPIDHRLELKKFQSFAAGKLSEVQEVYLYGANQAFVPALPLVGHTVYENGYVQAAYRNAAAQLLPHISLRVASLVRQPIPGQVRQLVNVMPPETLQQRTLSMLPAFSLAKQRKAIPIIANGDVVLLLPAMYTGGTDWAQTPYGMTPGGFILASSINSALNNTWITDISARPWMVVVAMVIGLVVGSLTLPVFGTLVFAAAMVLGFIGLALLLFSYGQIALPWAVPSGAFVLWSGLAISVRQHRLSLDAERMSHELETAKLVQSSFLPDQVDSPIGMEFHHRSMEECCGDWWGHAQIGADKEIVCLTDATGHGAPAALMTAMAFSAFQLATRQLPTVVESWPTFVLRTINDVCMASEGLGRGQRASMTAVVVVFEKSLAKAHLAVAGHVPPYILSDQGQTPIYCPGAPLGIFSEKSGAFTLETTTIEFGPGNRLLLMTDGVYEREDGRPLSHHRLVKRAFAGNSRLGSNEIIAKLLAEVQAHNPNTIRNDDETIIVCG